MEALQPGLQLVFRDLTALASLTESDQVEERAAFRWWAVDDLAAEDQRGEPESGLVVVHGHGGAFQSWRRICDPPRSSPEGTVSGDAVAGQPRPEACG